MTSDAATSPRSLACPDCDSTGEVFDHLNEWGKAETTTCGLCHGRGVVDAGDLAWIEAQR